MQEDWTLINVVLDFNVYGTNVVAWLRHIITRADESVAVNELTSKSFLEGKLYERAEADGRGEWSNSDLLAEIAAQCGVGSVALIEPEPPEAEK